MSDDIFNEIIDVSAPVTNNITVVSGDFSSPPTQVVAPLSMEVQEISAPITLTRHEVTAPITLGTQGPQGIQGIQGIQGVQGIQGEQGNPGADGLDGATGPEGPQGPQGLIGPDGVQGPIGPEGPEGPIGPEGPVATDATYESTSITINTGTFVSGNLTSIQTQGDSSTYVVQEVTGVPGFDVEVEFATTDYFNEIHLISRYQGNPAHVVLIQLWNYQTSAWNTFATITSESALIVKQIQVPSSTDYISTNVSKCRIYHSTSGVGTHTLTIDYFALHKSIQGAKGDTGPEGPQGIQGIQGIDGPQGVDGIQGPAGSDASVTKSNVEAVLTGMIHSHSHEVLAETRFYTGPLYDSLGIVIANVENGHILTPEIIT